MLLPVRNPPSARVAGVVYALVAGLSLVGFFDLLHAGSGPANSKAPSSVVGSLTPSSDSEGAMVPTAIAYSHIEALRNLVWARNQRYRAVASARFRARLAQLGVGDIDQAILFQGVGPGSLGASIVSEYYARATSPLGRALSMLKVRSAPREVSRAALIAMDSQVRAMLEAEPDVLALAEQAQELNAQEFALRQQELGASDRHSVASNTFAISFGTPGCFPCDRLPVNSKQTALHAAATADGGRLQKLGSEVSALTTSEAKIARQFRATKLPIVTDLGAQATPPIAANPEPPDIVPVDAIQD